nr:ATP-binding cassette domain-containing protein [uncultured Sphingomonas sp.]
MRFEIDLERRLGDAVIALSFASDAPVTALVGPSGIGKSTILNMIAGIRTPDQGRIAVNDRQLFNSAQDIDVPPELRRCGYVFQENRLFPHYRVRGNLLYGVRQAVKEPPKGSFDEVVALLGLEHLLNRWPGSLSGGEARRVAIGRALLSSPDFLLLDEPLTSLDPDRREIMMRTVEDIRENYNLPILYVSHQQDEVARIAGHVVQMTE